VTDKAENAVAKPPNSAFNYFGGKGAIADWIIGHFPPHGIYCEPYGGAANVLLRKPPAKTEVYNDLNSEVVNFFRVLRTPGQRDELIRTLELTPYSREEHKLAFGPRSDDPVENARRFLVRAQMSRDKNSMKRTHETFDNRCFGPSGACSAKPSQWRQKIVNLSAVAERLQDVIIDNKPSLEAIKLYDWPNTLFYCDPPYVHSSRRTHLNAYHSFEMSDDEHAALAEALHSIKGCAVVSGYRSALYDELYKDWRRVDKRTRNQRGDVRTESMWLSPGIKRAPRLF
jgi:DNA adenine methylase